jgi:hypothetical protein
MTTIITNSRDCNVDIKLSYSDGIQYHITVDTNDPYVGTPLQAWNYLYSQRNDGVVVPNRVMLELAETVIQYLAPKKPYRPLSEMTTFDE